MQDVPTVEVFSSIGQGSSLSGDPASALRAAALSTIKAKRRHPTTLRPVHHDTSVRLDYGQASEPPLVATSVTVAPLSAPLAPKPPPSEAEDGQTREEGEISDSETSVVPHRPSLQKSKSTSVGIEDAGQRRPPSVGNESSLRMTRDDIHESLPHPTSTSIADGPDIASSEWFQVIVDADHVRPGLTMTQEQYNQAKDIILDLLGWGVEPEYLVQCNLSREIIYYVFTELNLKMPPNFDTTDLIPYPSSPEYLNYTPGVIQTSGSTHMKISASGQDSISASTENGRASRHDYFPVKPPKFSRVKSTPFSPAHPESASPASTTSAASSAPLARTVIPHPSLHDMERQRRQELLARKAVQASRKPKLSQSQNLSPNSGTERHQGRDIDPPTDSPQVSVDDFLNSIGSVPPSDYKSSTDGTHRGPVTERSDYESSPMEVDASSSDVVGHPGPGRLITPPQSPLSVQSSSTSVRSDSAPPTDPTSDSPTVRITVEPSSTLLAVSSTDPSAIKPVDEKYPEIRGNSNVTSHPALRRGLKRPVAADFVDVESGPSRSHPGNGQNTTIWKKSGGFASVSGVRRCVIDLSDSEDEAASRGMRMDLADDGERRTTSFSAPVIPTQPRAHSGRTTPATPLQSVALSPAILMEKEEEIRRMRELIAQREQNRLKKLALSSRFTRNATRTDRGEEDSLLRSSTDGGSQLNGDVIDIVMQERNSLELPATADATIPGYVTPPIDDPTSNTADIATPAAGDVGQEGSRTSTERQSYVVADGWTDVIPDGNEYSTLGGQGSIDQADSALHAYDSLFERYPLLRSHLRPVFSGTGATLESAWTALLPLLKGLKLATVAQVLDPDKKICQYEVPGGGVCRAEDCENVHLSKTMIEPGDNESAQCIYEGFPVEWQRRFNVEKLVQAFAQVRERNVREGKPGLGLEALVRQTLMDLLTNHQAQIGTK